MDTNELCSIKIDFELTGRLQVSDFEELYKLAAFGLGAKEKLAKIQEEIMDFRKKEDNNEEPDSEYLIEDIELILKK